MKNDSHGMHIELLEDVVLPQVSGSASGQPTLRYLPGAVILGALAATLYRKLDEQDAWTVFHSGAVRFTNGLPIHGGEPAYPMPLSWFALKEGPVLKGAGDDLHACAQHIHNAHGITAWDGMKPLRHHFVTQSGRRVRIEPGAHLRTAIDPETGRAADAQLYSYESIPAGQHFRASVEFDASVQPVLRERVLERLQGVGLLGRSRTAEYGRVRITPVAAAEPLARALFRNRLMLWLLSDMAALDAHGQPTFQPDGASLGLPRGTFNAGASYIATRRYAPYNGYRRGRDLDRPVLAAGSVLVLDGIDAQEPGVLETLARGVGRHREQGLGQVAVNPALLADAHPQFAPRAASPTQTARAADATRQHPDLARWQAWMGQHATQRAHIDTHEREARELLSKWEAWLEQARFHRGRDADVGPSPAQWGAVRDATADASGAELVERLFGVRSPAIPASSPGWSDLIDASSPHSTLREALRKALGEKPDSHMVMSLARQAQDKARNRRKGVSL